MERQWNDVRNDKNVVMTTFLTLRSYVPNVLGKSRVYREEKYLKKNFFSG